MTPEPQPYSRGALSADLLDANESNWTFVAVDRVGYDEEQQVKRLAALASGARVVEATADGLRTGWPERAGAGPFSYAASEVLQERVLRSQAALGERAQRERLGVAQTDTAADGILHAHEQVPQLV